MKKKMAKLFATVLTVALTAGIVSSATGMDKGYCFDMWYMDGTTPGRASIGTGEDNAYILAGYNYTPEMILTACSPEKNYCFSPDGMAQYIDATGTFADQIDVLKLQGKLPAYYQYRPVAQYPKTDAKVLLDMQAAGVDFTPVFQKDWYETYVNVGRTEYFEKSFSVWATNYLLAGAQASPAFDVDAYKEFNPDLYAVFGNDNVAYVIHYLTYGINEGRVATYPPERVKNYYLLNPDKAVERKQRALDTWASLGIPQ